MHSSSEILYEDGQHAICSVGNAIVSHSLSEPTATYFSECIRIESTMRRMHAHTVFFVAIRNDAPPPADEARRVINEFFSRTQHHIGAVVLVVEGEGFLAAAKRSALAMIGFTSRYTFPFRVTGTVDAGLRYVSEKNLLINCGTRDVSDAVDRLKRHLEQTERSIAK